MATIEKRAGKYRVKVRVKGQPPATATFPLKKQAQRWAQETYVKMVNCRYFGAGYSKTFTDLVVEYQNRRQALIQAESTINVARSVLAYFQDAFGSKVLSHIKAADISEALDQLQREEYKRSTINRYLATLSAVFSYAVEKEWLEVNPCSRVRRLKVKEERGMVLSDEQEARLFKALAVHSTTRDAARFALMTGARLSECLELRCSDVEQDGSAVTFRNTKNGDDRTIPICAVATYTISDSPLPFHGFKRGVWEKAVRESELTGLRFHDLRHTFITRAIARGVSPAHVAAYVGHKSLTMTAKYTHLTHEDIRGVIEP